MNNAGGMYPGLPTGQQNYPGPQPNYPAATNYPGSQPAYGGYPQWGNPGFQQSSSDGYSGTVVNPGPGYPNNSGGAGPSAPTCMLIFLSFFFHTQFISSFILVSKEEEANQSANYNARMLANQQNNGGFAPPPDMNVSHFYL